MMTVTLTPGKWRGLKTTSTAAQGFAILAFDQRGSYRKMLPEGTAFETAAQIKREVVQAVSPHASAVLLDPIYGLDAAQQMAGSSGLLMAIEKTGYSGEATARRIDFIEGWGVEKIKGMGASAAKLLCYYHPDAGEAAEHIEETIRQLAAQCRAYDLPLFVEPLVYSPDPAVKAGSAAFAEMRPGLIRETVRRLAAAGADVLKIEFPVDVKFVPEEAEWRRACEAISEVATVPWALLSAGVDFDTFERQVRVACQSGASGFLGGRAIWREVVTMPASERGPFLQGTVVERMKTLRTIVEREARPWTDYYEPLPAVEGWFRHYVPQGSDDNGLE